MALPAFYKRRLSYCACAIYVPFPPSPLRHYVPRKRVTATVFLSFNQSSSNDWKAAANQRQERFKARLKRTVGVCGARSELGPGFGGPKRHDLSTALSEEDSAFLCIETCCERCVRLDCRASALMLSVCQVIL